MKNLHWPWLAIVLITFLASTVWGSDKLQFQGFLTDELDRPLEAQVELTLSIYNEAGEVQWTEAQTVTVTGGLINGQLGAVEPMTAVLFETSPLFLGIQVGDDEEMTPRFELGAPRFPPSGASTSTAAL